MIKYIADRDHYSEVLARCGRVKHDLWIGTADLKDLYVGSGTKVVPFLAVLDGLLRRGVEVRLLHAKEPGENFRADFDRYPGLWTKLERRLCPRVHFKIMVFDCSVAYIGSANLTGAGIGMKGEGNRNFEAGMLTDEPSLVDAAADHLDSVWQGLHCAKCKRKDFCGDRISG
ncbi:MAG: phospholipase [Bacteroidales bacterium]|nr:phospholipase [Bacteroidales bacterium]